MQQRAVQQWTWQQWVRQQPSFGSILRLPRADLGRGWLLGQQRTLSRLLSRLRQLLGPRGSKARSFWAQLPLPGPPGYCLCSLTLPGPPGYCFAQEPLMIVDGKMQYLFDEKGRRYLDVRLGCCRAGQQLLLLPFRAGH